MRPSNPSLKSATLLALYDEVRNARTKFPSNQKLFAALIEEVGEVGKALAEGKSAKAIQEELLQVATVALRMYEEGDPAYLRECDECEGTGAAWCLGEKTDDPCETCAGTGFAPLRDQPCPCSEGDHWSDPCDADEEWL